MAKRTHCSHGHEYTEENTYRDSTNRRHCKTCRREASRKWREGTQVGYANSRKTHCAKGHEYSEENTLYTIKPDGKTRRNCRTCGRENSYTQRFKKYGITESAFKEMMDSQDGACAICQIPFIRSPHIDHCHETGKVRGLLCYPCNSALGQLGDEIYLFRRAIKYLKRGEFKFGNTVK